MIEALDATVSHIVINALRDEIFFATIVLDREGGVVEVDARPSDAINLAVRTSAAIFVEEQVLVDAGVIPEPGLEETTADEEDSLEVFADFLESLDLDDLGEE
jgi:bifunctional DNase/RNase